MVDLELEDMQGLIMQGYKDLPAARYLLLKIDEPTAANGYFRYLIENNLITPAETETTSSRQYSGRKYQQAIHVAFTSQGLRRIGLDEKVLETFSREFLEGMVTHFRSELLGDVRDNSPKKWKWGNCSNCVHCMLMLFSRNQDELEKLTAEHTFRFTSFGLSVVSTQDTHENALFKKGLAREHFGFRDGISNPRMEGAKDTKNIRDAIKAGEFVLGYKNEYGSYTDRPYAPITAAFANVLPDYIHNGTLKKDLGKNGTYLVYRQISQDVFNFWKFQKENSRESGETEIDRAIHLASKMIGRWPDGHPLSLYSNSQKDRSPKENFSFARNDEHGYGCPFGSHIRRANPRDQLHSGRTIEQSRQMVRKHQILRRGRIYGAPLVPSMRPEEMILITDDDFEPRGLHFICLVGHIQRQFEFIQNVWANNFTFADLCNEVDPLISPRPAECEPLCNEFTVQDPRGRRNYRNIPQFTRVVGGAYFFLPGLRALKFIVLNGGDYIDPERQYHLASYITKHSTIKEKPHKKEIEFSEKILSLFNHALFKKYGEKRFQRGLHAKSLGLVSAEVQISDNIPLNLKFGILAAPKRYLAWVRFTNASPTIALDSSRGARGMAIKILDVGGPTLEPDDLGQTQDILLTNNQVIFPGRVQHHYNALKVIFISRIYFLSTIFRTITGLFRFLRGQIKIESVLNISYFSGTPYLMGPLHAIKWMVRPDKIIPIDKKLLGKNFLRAQLKDTLEKQDVSFGLYIQVQGNQEKESIEHSGNLWKGSFIRVGTITLLKETGSDENRLDLEKTIQFSPWHSLEDHRPLGGINRLRREVYKQLSRIRKRHNKSLEWR